MSVKENGRGPMDHYLAIKLKGMREQGIISRHPTFIVKWALPILISILTIIIIVAWTLRYPEMVRTRAALTASNATGSSFYATIELTKNNINDVRPGQLVEFRFDEYPSRKYGFITGTIQKITNTNGLSAWVLLKDLNTSKNVAIPFKAGMKANAFIVARNTNLLERIFYKSNIVTSIY